MPRYTPTTRVMSLVEGESLSNAGHGLVLIMLGAEATSTVGLVSEVAQSAARTSQAFSVTSFEACPERRVETRVRAPIDPGIRE